MKFKKMMPYLEADGGAAGGSGAGEGAGGSEGTGQGGANGGTQTEKPLTFDDFLKSGNNQAEFDRRMTKGIETAVTKERDRLNALHNDKLTEVEKLSQMNETERSKYLADKKTREMAEREANITRRELAAEAKETLAGKKLPISLAEIINYTDADSCKKSIETIEKTFNAAVEKAVEDKLKGGKPHKDAGTEGTDDEKTALDKQIMAALKGRN